jgi:hypothetical protein
MAKGIEYEIMNIVAAFLQHLHGRMVDILDVGIQ